MATNCDLFVVTFYAALQCGAIVVPVQPTDRAGRDRYLLEAPGAAVFAFDPPRPRPEALPFTEARVADLEGHDVGPGGVGELLLRGESVMKGYGTSPPRPPRRSGAAAGPRRPGRVDSDGYLTLVDRPRT